MSNVPWTNNVAFPVSPTITSSDKIMGLQSNANTKWNFSTIQDTILGNVIADSAYGEMYFSGNTTPTVILTRATPVQINATYNTGLLNLFTLAGGTLTYTGTFSRVFQLSVMSSSTMNLFNDDIMIIFYVNGIPVVSSELSYDLDGTTPSLKSTPTQCLVTLNTGDIVQVFVANTTSTNSITVSSLNARVASVGGIASTVDLQDAYNAGNVIVETASRPVVLQSDNISITPSISFYQTLVPTLFTNILNIQANSVNNLDAPIKYGEINHQIISNDSVTGTSQWIFSSTAGSVLTDLMSIRGDINAVVMLKNTVMIGDAFQQSGLVLFNNGYANTGTFTVAMTTILGNSYAYQIDYSNPATGFDFNVYPTIISKGINLTYASSVSPVISYVSNGPFTTVWNVLDGTNIVAAQQFLIGQTIEIDMTGEVNTNITGVNIDSGSQFRISFSPFFSVVSDPIASGATGITTAKRTFALKIKITRVFDSGLFVPQITVSSAGYYYDLAGINKVIGIYFNPILIPYDPNTPGTLLVEFKNGNSGGNFAFVAKNLTISQYS